VHSLASVVMRSSLLATLRSHIVHALGVRERLCTELGKTHFLFCAAVLLGGARGSVLLDALLTCGLECVRSSTKHDCASASLGYYLRLQSESGLNLLSIRMIVVRRLDELYRKHWIHVRIFASSSAGCLT
jgi:hypothetical protein